MVRLVGDLRRRLASESANYERIERQLKRLAAELDQERKQRQVLEKRQQELQDELDAAELSLTGQVPESGSNSERSTRLAGITLLYVGGRTRNIAQLRILAEARGAVFLHHDGGIDDRSG
jgi:septal ring factor EnvC (AmiA/AmiB activator)